MPISDIPTNETVAFVTPYLQSGDRILEVGAGRGEVARRLRAAGYSVTAVDSSAEAVRAAADDGIEVIHADFMEFRADPFDVVVFTRSLHHLSPLESAVDKAHELTEPRGRIVVEDFAFDEMDGRTARWLYDELCTLRANGLLSTEAEGFGGEFLAAGGDLQEWKIQHDSDHPIHTAAEIVTGVERLFSITEREDAPYLYRYIAPLLADDPDGVHVLDLTLAQEKKLIDLGRIQPIGRRFVAECAGAGQ